MKINRSQFRDIIREFLEGDVSEEAPQANEFDAAFNQDRVMGDGGDAKMVKQQLFDLARKAQSLHDQLLDGDELPEWVQSKVAVMADNMSSVSDHLVYKLHQAETEAPDAEEPWGGIEDLQPQALDLMIDDDFLDDLEEADDTGVDAFVSSLDATAAKG